MDKIDSIKQILIVMKRFSLSEKHDGPTQKQKNSMGPAQTTKWKIQDLVGRLENGRGPATTTKKII